MTEPADRQTCTRPTNHQIKRERVYPPQSTYEYRTVWSFQEGSEAKCGLAVQKLFLLEIQIILFMGIEEMEPFAALRVSLRSEADPKSPHGWCGSECGYDTDDGKVWRSKAFELEASFCCRPLLVDGPIFFSL